MRLWAWQRSKSSGKKLYKIISSLAHNFDQTDQLEIGLGSYNKDRRNINKYKYYQKKKKEKEGKKIEFHACTADLLQHRGHTWKKMATRNRKKKHKCQIFSRQICETFCIHPHSAKSENKPVLAAQNSISFVFLHVRETSEEELLSKLVQLNI